ncbi:desulfoferrodoxin [Acetobacterium fimetarium]|uniref:Desulfoferrodoxin n=1 Tax=Acetobacterium fimetarium TaxID=52691 RepID=A0ABR6WVI0_9FIRM|nr:desulfoferrodoxin family protein [Acetobacterium fimetarium]MBC3804555.1 desulfoferrodoxin [Acetobacterium fimetarium]
MDKKIFYQCDNCNSTLLEMSGTVSQYCDHNLIQLVPNAIDASKEKHVPVLKFDGHHLHVKVGSTPHPMTLDHSILWIFVQTRNGGLYVQLAPEDQPEADFMVLENDVVAVYAYCDVHGLWIADHSELDFEETVCSSEFSDGCIG